MHIPFGHSQPKFAVIFSSLHPYRKIRNRIANGQRQFSARQFA